jgi:superfamily I DNA and RNA helicase
MKLIINYENAVENIAKEICKIFDCEYDKADWTNCEIGDMFSIGNMFLSLDDMIIILKMNATRQEYVAYYDERMNGRKINLKNWLKMARSKID